MLAASHSAPALLPLSANAVAGDVGQCVLVLPCRLRRVGNRHSRACGKQRRTAGRAPVRYGQVLNL
jgi:hypothetical protein